MKWYRSIFVSICYHIFGNTFPLEASIADKMRNNYIHNLDYVVKKHQESSALLASFSDFNVTDYGGLPIKFAVANHPPFLILGPSIYGFKIDGVDGYGQAWDLLASLSKFFKFRPVIVEANINSIGYKNPSGSWQGIVGMLSRKETDVTLLPIVLSKSRMSDIDFSIPLRTSYYGMLVRRPRSTQKPDALLRPFTWAVWVWILGSMITMGPLIYTMTWIRIRLCKRDSELKKLISLSDCIWFVYGAMMKQGSNIEPIADSIRILFATWWIYTVIVTAFYTANLTAFLTFNGLELSILDVQSLQAHPEISWLAPLDDALNGFIQTHPRLEILKKMEVEGRGHYVQNSSEALELVRNGTHVYIDDMQVLDYLIYTDFINGRQRGVHRCDFYTVLLEKKSKHGDPLDLVFYSSFGYTKNSTFQNDFDTFFKRLNSYGILTFLRQNYSSISVCDIPKGFKERPLKNKDLLTTYFTVFLGALFGAVAFLTEFIHGKTKSNVKSTVKSPGSCSRISLIKPDKNSFLPAPIFHEQFVVNSSNSFPILPKNRRDKRFPVTYSIPVTSSQIKKLPSLPPKHKRKMILASKKSKSRTVKNLQRTEMALRVSPFPMKETRQQDEQDCIVEGT